MSGFVFNILIILNKSRKHPIRQIALQRYLYAVTAARCNAKRISIQAVHLG